MLSWEQLGVLVQVYSVASLHIKDSILIKCQSSGKSGLFYIAPLPL